MHWHCLSSRRRRSPRAHAWASARRVVVLCAAATACGREPHGVPQRVVIAPGTTLRAAADSLARAGVIRDPWLFRIYASLKHHDRDVKAGTYLLQRDLPWSEALDALAHGMGLVHTVTIPEGWDLSEITPLLERALGAPPESIAAAVRDSDLLVRVGAPGPTLEGYLFPDTYFFPDGTTARAAVIEMVRAFEREWQPKWDDAREAAGMSRHDVVTLASIIEKEARLPDERPVISAVYHNRLRLGMPLQADPTIQYALGHHVDRVTFKDLSIASAYNTYRHAGLPPGPIGSPGAASLEAAVDPANVPYLYFVAAPDGHHEFRTTFAAHKEARHELRRQSAHHPPAGSP
jgi:UPF0755 protein